MIFNKNLKNVLLVIFATLVLSACSTAKKSGNIDGDVYTGKETVEYLHSLEKITTVFIDDSFEKCGLHSEIQKHISKDIQFKSLSRNTQYGNALIPYAVPISLLMSYI